MTDKEKIVYDILCSEEQPPEGQHWEGFVASKIVAALAQPEPEQEACSVLFPRHTPKHGEDWIIDPSFLLRVYHSIDPDAHYGFIPTMEEIETALLALEVISSNLYTAPPKKEWVNLTVEERETLRDAYQDSFSGLISAVQMLLKEKNT